MVKIRRYIIGDDVGMRLRPEMSDVDRSLMYGFLKTSKSWTVICNDKPVAIGGICHVWEGRGHFWGFIGEVPTRAWPKIMKNTLEILDEAALDYERLEVVCKADWPAAIRTIAKLGFKIESVMKNYHKGNDYLMGVY